MLHQSAWWNNAALHHVAVRGAWACTVPTPHLLLSDALSAASRFQLRLSHLPSQSETPCLVCFLLQPFFLPFFMSSSSFCWFTLCRSLSPGHTHTRARARRSLYFLIRPLSLTCAHTASVTQTTIHLCLILSVSLAPSLPPILYQAHSREELNLCDAAAAAAAWAYAHSREWWDT